jgi:hypothetical protein
MVTVDLLMKRENCRSLAEQGNEQSCQCNRTGEALISIAPVVSQGQGRFPRLTRGLFGVILVILDFLLRQPRMVRLVCPNSRPQERHEFEKIERTKYY